MWLKGGQLLLLRPPLLTFPPTQPKISVLYAVKCTVQLCSFVSILPFSFKIKVRLRRSAWHGYQWCVRKKLLMCIGYSSSVIWIPPKNFICPLCKLRTEITSPIAKSTSPGLSDTTFFAHWPLTLDFFSLGHTLFFHCFTVVIMMLNITATWRFS